jgi:hypothetical protein
MAIWSLEQRGCFTPGVTAGTIEFRPCGPLLEPGLYSAWTDGTNWLDDIEGSGGQVGWLELDGVTYWPPLDIPL